MVQATWWGIWLFNRRAQWGCRRAARSPVPVKGYMAVWQSTCLVSQHFQSNLLFFSPLKPTRLPEHTLAHPWPDFLLYVFSCFLCSCASQDRGIHTDQGGFGSQWSHWVLMPYLSCRGVFFLPHSDLLHLYVWSLKGWANLWVLVRKPGPRPY